MTDGLMAANRLERMLSSRPRSAAAENPWDGISAEGREHIAQALVEASFCTAVELATGSEAAALRSRLRVLVALVPDTGDLRYRVLGMLGNRQVDADDIDVLIADRQHEVTVDQLRRLVRELRAGASAKTAAAAATCSVRTAAQVASFLGCTQAVEDVLRDAAYGWAWEQYSFDVWARLQGLTVVEAAPLYRLELARRAPLTRTQLALLGPTSFAQAFADMYGVSRSKAYRLLADADVTVRQVEGLPHGA